MKINNSFRCKIGGSWHKVEVVNLKGEDVIIGSKSKGIVCIKNEQEKFLPIYDLEDWVIENERLYLRLLNKQVFSIKLEELFSDTMEFHSEGEFPQKRKDKIGLKTRFLETPLTIFSFLNFWVIVYPRKGIEVLKKGDLKRILHFDLPIYSYIDDAFIYNNKIFLADVLGLRILNLKVNRISNLLEVELDETFARNRGWPKDIALKDNLILVADVFGIKIYDKNSCRLLGKLESPRNRIAKVIIKDHLAFLSCEAFGLKIIDISNCMSPRVCSGIFLPRGCWDAHIVGDYIYLAGYTEGLFRADLNNLKNIKVENVFNSGEEVIGVYATGERVFVASSYSGIKIFNRDLKLIIEHEDTLGRCWTVIEKDGIIYAACGNGGVEIFQMCNERELKRLSRIKTREARDLVVEEGLLYIADGQKGVLIYDISNPSSPQFVKHIPSAAFTRGVMVDKDHIYKADGDGGVEIYAK